MVLILKRRAYLDEGTLGYMQVSGAWLYTLELPWFGNHHDKSCIPLGTYPLAWSESPRHGWILRLREVPGRSDIEIHPANLVKELRGCIAVGRLVRLVPGKLNVELSQSAMQILRELRADGEPSSLRIENYEGGVL